MIREHRSVVIHYPVEDALAYVIDPRNNAEWHGWIIESVVTTGGPIRVGTEAKSIGKFLGKTVEANAVVAEVVPSRSSTGGFTATSTIRPRRSSASADACVGRSTSAR
jgi:hypothetical protein